MRARARGRRGAVVLALTLNAAGLSGRPTSLPAQQTDALRHSPWASCCVPALMSPLHVDTAPGLLRVTGLATAARERGEQWRVVSLRVEQAHGAWYRPQTARADQISRFTVDGAQTQMGWHLTGGVTMQRRRESDVAWRAQSDASRGLVYVWADTVGGTFRSDELALAGRVVTPAWHGFTLGVPLALGLGQGARRNDPRPLYRRRTLEAIPALQWGWGRHALAVGLELARTREDVEIGGASSNDSPTVYRLRGMATFDRTQLNSGERALLGGGMGVRGGFARHGDRWHLAAGGRWMVALDSVRDGIATPVDGGRTRREQHEARIAARWQGVSHGLDAEIGQTRETGSSRDPVFRAINVVDEASVSALTLAWWSGAHRLTSAGDLLIRAGIARYARRDIAAEARWRARTPTLQAQVGRSWSLGPGRVRAHVGAGYRHLTDTLVHLPRPSRTSADLLVRDAGVVGARGWSQLGGLSWEARRQGNRPGVARPISVALQWGRQNTQIWGDRQQWMLDVVYR